MANRQSIRSIAKWLEAQGRPISRPTLQKHLEHALDPKSGFVEAAKPQIVKRVTSTEFLQTVVDVAAAKAEDHSQVSLDHGLRAAQILEQKQDRGRDSLRVLVLHLMGQAPAVTIEGEYKELPT